MSVLTIMVISVVQHWEVTCKQFEQHYTDDSGASTAPGVSTDPGQTDTSSSNIVMVAGVAVSVIVLVLAAICIILMVIWWR